ncbi:MAG: PAS domain S-box protein, partial [Candidatus Eisenbacteria bacterium]
MGAKQKTKKQLMEELAETRRRVSELEANVTSLSNTKRSSRPDHGVGITIDALPTPYQSLDNDGQLIDVNQAWVDMLGYSREEVLGRRFSDLLGPQSKDHFWPRFQRFKADGEIHGSEFWILKKNGSLVRAAYDGVVAYDDAGRFVRSHCIMSDLTDRVRMEQELRESDVRFRFLVENSPDRILQVDRDGKILITSRAYEGVTQSEVVGTSVFDWMADDFRKTLKSALERVWESGVAEVIEFEATDPQGRELSCSANIGAISDNGEVESAVVVIRDITPLVQARGRLKAETDKLSQYFESLPLFAYNVDFDGRIADCNSMVLSLLGYASKDELLGKLVTDTIYAPSSREKAKELLSKWKREGKLRNEEMQIITKQGKVLDVLLNVETIVDQNGKPVHSLSTQMDITEHKRTQAAVRNERNNLLNVLGAMEDGILIVDEDYEIIYVNARIESSYGTWQGRKCYEYFNQRTGICPHCPGLTVFQGETARREWKCPRTGRVYDLVDTLIKNPDGSRHRIEVFRDITERREAEEYLRRSEEKYRKVVSTTTDAIMVFDAESRRFIETNPACETMYGYSRAEFLDLTVDDVTAELEDTKAAIQEALTGELTRIPLRWHRRRDGSVFAVEISAGVFVQEGRSVLVAVVRDITDRLAAHRTLQEERDRAQMYLDMADVVLLALDENGRVTLVNRKGREILGCEQEDIIGEIWFDRFLPESARDEVKGVFRELMSGEGRKVEHFENRLLTTGGEERIVAWRTRILRDEKGRFAGTFSSGEDITERKRAEEKLMRSERRLSTIFKANPDPTCVTDSERRIQAANPAFLRLVDKTLDQIREMDALEFFAGETRETIETAIRIMRAGKEVRGLEVKARVGGAETRYFEVNAIPLPGEGDPGSVLCVTRDITQRKLAERALAESEEEYRLVSQNIPVAVYFVLPDEHSTTFFVSDRIEQLTGYEGKEFLKDPGLFTSILHPDDRNHVWEKISELRRGKAPGDIEYRVITKDGTVKWIADKAAPLFDENGEIDRIHGFMEDITQRVTGEQALLKR